MSVETLDISHCTPCAIAEKNNGFTSAGLRTEMQKLAQKIVFWHQRNRSRKALAKLDDRLLEDIGLSRADVDQEIEKPFWVR